MRSVSAYGMVRAVGRVDLSGGALLLKKVVACASQETVETRRIPFEVGGRGRRRAVLVVGRRGQ